MHLLVVIIKEGISGVTHKRVSFYGTLNLWLNPQVIPHSQIKKEEIREKAIKAIHDLPEDNLRLWKYDKRYPLWLKYQLQDILIGIYQENNKVLFEDYLLAE